MKHYILLILVITNIFALNLNPQMFKLNRVTNNTAIIDNINAKIGESGIILHQFSDKKISILTYATIIKTTEKNATIKFLDDPVLKQDAIPTTNLKPQKNDFFLLNHLYNASLLITPNFRTADTIEKLYPKNNFLNSDIFASYLKMQNNPTPTNKDIQDFAKHHNLGTIFIAIKNKAYILDTFSFKILDTITLDINDKSTQVPFFTNVQEIKTSAWDWFSDDKINNYNTYYSNLIGLKNDRK